MIVAYRNQVANGRRSFKGTFVSLVLLSLGCSPLEALELSSPVACEVARECPIIQGVDRDPGAGVLDAYCGSLSYDGHKGVDFSLPSWSHMAEGVEVLAVAPGVVRGVRDGMADRPGRGQSNGNFAGRECGNGVSIDHGDGWITQYCHLRLGSVLPETGDNVEAGTPLGLIGASGNADFPHLHFSIRRDGTVVDPFDGREATAQCSNPEDADSLWSAPGLQRFRTGGLLSVGFVDRVPGYDEVWNEAISLAVLQADSAGLVAWGHAYGLREGDIIDIRIVSPGGEDFARDRYVMPRNRATQFRAVGRRLPNDDAPPGFYLAEIALVRNGEVLDQMTTRVELLE